MKLNPILKTIILIQIALLPLCLCLILTLVLFIASSDKQKTSPQKVENPISYISDFQVQGVQIEKEELFKVTKIVDGDTIKVDDHGEIMTIRLIGIDTPETVDPRKPVQCFGQEATNKMKELIEGKFVSLKPDDTQDDQDRYGRFLRYVFLENGTNVNLEMIRQGFAYEYTYKIPYIYQSEFKAAQEYATDNSLGLWGLCNITY
jgi:micrococcal nuclease